MEIVAMDMKLRGMYIARQLSFTGVTFKIEEVPLSQRYIDMYNKSVRLVRADPPPPIRLKASCPETTHSRVFGAVGARAGEVPAGRQPHGCGAADEEVHVGAVLVRPPEVLQIPLHRIQSPPRRPAHPGGGPQRKGEPRPPPLALRVSTVMRS